MLTDRTTLTQFLIEERRRYPDASGNFNALVTDGALACKAISRRIACGALGGVPGNAAMTNPQDGQRRTLDLVANDLFLRANEWRGWLAGMASEEMAEPHAIPGQHPRGNYLLVFDPLDGSPNIDVNVSVGSIFSILRAPRAGEALSEAQFLQPGTEQVCAGYAIYGPSTMLVLTVGNGVHGFALEPQLGEYALTHPGIRIAEQTAEFAINASNSRFWAPAVKRYVGERLAGQSGPRGRDYNMRWMASLVAEAHRILMRGGVFLYPRDTRDGAGPGRLRLLYQCNPVSLLVEQAGGAASTGHDSLLQTRPTALHQRIGLVFCLREEVERIERYHAEQVPAAEYDSPLFASRGLFRANA